MWWYHIMVLIFTSLRTDDFEHLFTYPFAIFDEVTTYTFLLIFNWGICILITEC